LPNAAAKFPLIILEFYHCKQKWAYPFDLRGMHSPNKNVFFGKIMMLLLLEATGEKFNAIMIGQQIGSMVVLQVENTAVLNIVKYCSYSIC
jgi:hypothetical protein